MQVLQKQWDPTFSDSSYGFRPGRSTQGRLSPDFLKNPEAYLCQAARNQARDLMRSSGRRKFSTDPLERLAVPAPEMEDPWMFDALTEAMEELGPDAAQAIALRYSEDLSDAE